MKARFALRRRVNKEDAVLAVLRMKNALTWNEMLAVPPERLNELR